MNNPVSNNDINQLKAAIDTLSLQFTQHKQFVERELKIFAPLLVPLGSVISYSGDLSTIGPAWQVCDGSNITDPESPFVGTQTPKLNDYRYVVGVPNQQAIRTSIGSNEWQDGAHWHHVDITTKEGDVRTYPYIGSHSLTASQSRTMANHGHKVDGDVGGGCHDHGDKRPLSLGVHWIMRIK